MNEPIDGAFTPRDVRNMNRKTRLSAIWAVVYVGCTFVLAGDYIESVPLRWLLAFLPSVFAAFSVGAYWRYLREADELRRAIELKALALSVSAGFITWPAVELVKLGVPLDIPVNLILLVMVGFYVFGLYKGRKEYA